MPSWLLRRVRRHRLGHGGGGDRHPATEAVPAANGTAFIGEVRRITGLDLHILDGSEEAFGAAMGVHGLGCGVRGVPWATWAAAASNWPWWTAAGAGRA
ncbi:MAG: hypothetical protein R3D03_04610 [Geminicoccaceae bacterium]